MRRQRQRDTEMGRETQSCMWLHGFCMPTYDTSLPEWLFWLLAAWLAACLPACLFECVVDRVCTCLFALCVCSLTLYLYPCVSMFPF